MKAREARRKVLINARLRHGAGWGEAQILNISSRGLMLRASKAPARGTYVEVVRGHHSMVARVMWVDSNRFGCFAQDVIPVDAVAEGGSEESDPAILPPPRLRRRAPSIAESLARSHRRANAMQFLWLAGLGVAAGSIIFASVQSTLSPPLDAVSAALVDQ